MSDEEVKKELKAQLLVTRSLGEILEVSDQRRRRINAALALIRSVRDGNGWKEIPVGVLNQIEAILLGDTNETENHDGK